MKHRERRYGLASLCLALFLSACGGEGYEGVRNLHSFGQTIICFGDSLTEGVGADPGRDYPSVLSRKLGFPIHNAGRRGDTTAAALERLSRDVLDKNPRLVVVLLGGNDFLRQVPLKETEKNLAAIIERIQTRGAMVVLAGLRLGLLTDRYGSLFEELAKQHGALYVPQVTKGIFSDAKLKSDAIHPNAAGYQLIAERIAEKITPLLAAADRKKGGSGSG